MCTQKETKVAQRTNNYDTNIILFIQFLIIVVVVMTEKFPTIQ